MMNLDLLIPKDAPKGGSWAWARITTGYDSEDDYSVSIRLDGEDADLQATPIFLCDPEEFFDTNSGPIPQRSGRSLVQILDGQVFVYGEGGGLPRAPAAQFAAGRYEARSGRILWTSSGPAIHVGDGGTGWWDFAPTSGGSTAWRTTLTGYYPSGPPQGMTFYDTDLGKLMVWTGTTWKLVGPEFSDTGWLDIPATGRTASLGVTTAKYRVLNGMVQVQGAGVFTATYSIDTSGGAADWTIGVLPAGAKPGGLGISTWIQGEGPSQSDIRIAIYNGGTVTLAGADGRGTAYSFASGTSWSFMSGLYSINS